MFEAESTRVSCSVTSWMNVRAASCGAVRRGMAEMINNEVWGTLVAVTKRMSLRFVRVYPSGGREGAPPAAGGERVDDLCATESVSVAVGKQDLGKKK